MAQPGSEQRPPVKRRWRDYSTASGRRPVRDFIDALSDRDASAVAAGMEEVQERGLKAARHVQGDIWEVRASGERSTYRVLFAEEGSKGRVLLALEAFNKKTERTPTRALDVAKQRLGDWRSRGATQRANVRSLGR